MTSFNESMVSRDESGRFAAGRTGENDLTLDGIAHHIPIPEQVMALVRHLEDHGGHALLVGGSVRDSFDGRPPKDLDFEVYGASLDRIASLAAQHGRVDTVGSQFGVLKVTLPGGMDLDISVPRKDNKVGVGHRDFTVTVDADMDVTQAAARRDFTINAMSYDPQRGVLIDPYGGRDDLDTHVLRHVSDAFDEDPLRVLRGMQFAARYDARLAPDTARRCRALADQMDNLASERVRAEWEKFYTKGEHPDAGLRALRDCGWDRRFPGLAAINDDHLHAAAREAVRLAEHDQRVAVVAATLAYRMNETDASRFASATVTGSKMQRRVTDLARQVDLPTSQAQARRMAMDTSASLDERIKVAQAHGKDTGQAREVVAAAGVSHGPEKPWLDGQDVMEAGVSAGPGVGSTLREARLAQADRLFGDRDAALAWLKRRTRSA